MHLGSGVHASLPSAALTLAATVMTFMLPGLVVYSFWSSAAAEVLEPWAPGWSALWGWQHGVDGDDSMF